MKRENRRQERREKQIKFQEEIRNRRLSRPTKCKITKGEHIFNKPVEVGIGTYRYYTLVCACGKRTWNSPRLFPLSTMPQYTICEKHGWQNKTDKPCFACEMNLPEFPK